MGKSRGFWRICGGRDLSNVAPTASNVTIGTSSEVGETLTCTFSYDDVNGDLQGATTYQWYQYDDEEGTNETAIVGETSSTYTVLIGDLGLWLGCTVTPKALTGVLVGDPVPSNKKEVPNGYYVKVGGSDVAAGTSDATAWATIDKVNTELAAGNIDMPIYLNKGDEWNEAIDTSGEDNITIGSYGSGAKPILSGLTTLGDNWVAEGGDIWSYDLSALSPGDVRYVTSNGSRVYMAQTAINPAETGVGWTTSAGISGEFYDTDRGGTNADWVGGEAVMRIQPYHVMTYKITGYTSASGTFTYDGSIADHTLGSGHSYHIQNSLDCLDPLLNTALVNTEWVYVESTETLYMYHDTSDPFDLTGDIEVCIYDNLIDASNSDNVTISGIEFEFANYETISAYNASIMSVDSCDFSYAAQSVVFEAINSTTRTSSCSFTNNTTNYMGYMGVQFLYTDNYICTGNTLTNTAMEFGINFYTEWSRNGGRWYTRGYNAIQEYNCLGGLVDKNIINNVGYCGIWTRVSDHPFKVTRNYITNFCYILCDGGAIYSYSTGYTTGMEVANNIIIGTFNDATDEITGDDYGMHGVYCDYQTINAEVYNNYVEGCKRNVQLNVTGYPSGVGSYIHDNILVKSISYTAADSHSEVAVSSYGTYSMEQQIVENNTMVFEFNTDSFSYPIIYSNSFRDVSGMSFDYNKLLAPVGNKNVVLDDMVAVIVDLDDVTVTGTFTYNDTSPATISGTGFISAGFFSGVLIKIVGTASNDDTFVRTQSVTNAVITLDDTESLTQETVSSTITAEEELEILGWNNYTPVGDHETTDLLEYDMTGLGDPDNMIWTVTNTTDAVAPISFDAGYYYYDVDGNLISGTKYLQPYTGNVYLRTIEEGMPQASGVYVTGSYTVGQVVTGHYSFSHGEGDGEATSVFQWYTSDDGTVEARVAISNDGLLTYGQSDTENFSITSSEFNKYLVFGVTPVSDGAVATLTTGVERFFVTASKVF